MSTVRDALVGIARWKWDFFYSEMVTESSEWKVDVPYETMVYTSR